jgi:hypothetical protein
MKPYISLKSTDFFLRKIISIEQAFFDPTPIDENSIAAKGQTLSRICASFGIEHEYFSRKRPPSSRRGSSSFVFLFGKDWIDSDCDWE